MLLPNVTLHSRRHHETSSVGEFMDSSLGVLARFLHLPLQMDLQLEPSPLLHVKIPSHYSHTDKVHWLRLVFLLVRGLLQNAAVHSQQMQHEKALRYASLAKSYFQLLISNLRVLLEDHSQKMRRRENELMGDSPYLPMDSQPSDYQSYLRLGTLPVDFTVFAREVLEQDPSKVSSSSTTRPFSHVIMWKHNAENNDRYFRRELASRSRDLGVQSKLTTIGLREFNIGSVMHIKPLNLRHLDEDMDFSDYFNVKLAVELVLTYSCCLFSIATENRFICQKQFEAESKSNEWKGPSPQEAKKAIKLYKLQKNPNFLAS